MDFRQALSAYRTLDPAGWVAAYRLVPMWAGLLGVLMGVGLLLFGGGKAFRGVAGPMGALAGFLWAPVVAEHLGLRGLEGTVGAVAAAVLLALGFGFPPGLLFFAIGLPAGLAAGEMAGSGDWALGFIPSFLLTGTLAAAFARPISAVASAMLGAWLLVIGLLASLHQVGSIVAQVASQPTAVLTAAALFAVAGAVYQLAVQPSPDERERLRIDRATRRRRQEEKKRLEDRWANYSEKD